MPAVIPPPITTTHARVELTCLLCGRVAGYLQDGRRAALSPEHAASVGRLRCPACSGLLVTGAAYVVRRMRPLTAEERDERKGARR